MVSAKYRAIVISDFTIDNLVQYLNRDQGPPEIESYAAPYNQVRQVAMDETLECWEKKPDIAIVWTQPDSAIPSFNRILQFHKVSPEDIVQEVDDYYSLLLNIGNRVKLVLIASWVTPPYYRSFGMLDMKNNIGAANALMRMNLRLSENLEKSPNMYLLDSQKWVGLVGERAFNPKLWYMGKIPFDKEVFLEAVKDIKSAVMGITGSSKKLIVLDLDDVLWGGIVGDTGWEKIRLGGHDAIGEAFADFQRALKSFTNRGVILAIASKNEESLALEAINKHPEMVLKLDDFAGWKINWDDKAKNICDLASDLNLGLQSIVFIDDNPVERARVREALPEVFVPEWPKDIMLYKKTLLSLPCFNIPSLSTEDTERTKMYVTGRKRQALKSKAGSLDEWLKTLDTKVKVEELNETNLERTAQLLNKTNQMNLATRRMTESELAAWASENNKKLWTFGVSDKFGNLGLTGIISLEWKDKVGNIADFVLSCRVMGRKIEETMLHIVTKYARSTGLNEIRASYIPTAKNKPCLQFFEHSAFTYNKGQNYYVWHTKDEYALPDCIQIE
jgi:FkbH-like protein